MIPDTCIVIETDKFPILEGEEEELVNEGMYGKGLCLYLQKELPSEGMEAPFFCCEDWGWWIEVKDKDYVLGLCIYSDPDGGPGINPKKYVVISSITNETKWSWSKFRKINVSNNVKNILDAVERIFNKDGEIKKVTRENEYPF